MYDTHILTGIRLASESNERSRGLVKYLDPSDPSTVVIESRLRRKLRKNGYRLIKSRARSSAVQDYGHYCIFDLRRNLMHGIPGSKRVLNIDEIIGWTNIERTSDDY